MGWSPFTISIIAGKVQVGDGLGVGIVAARLIPGDMVDVMVRSAAQTGFLGTAKLMDLDTSPDFSVSYEDLLSPRV